MNNYKKHDIETPLCKINMIPELLAQNKQIQQTFKLQIVDVSSLDICDKDREKRDDVRSISKRNI
jgi:hypothetical protein